jgi:hypothetical protein
MRAYSRGLPPERTTAMAFSSLILLMVRYLANACRSALLADERPPSDWSASASSLTARERC